MIDDNEISRELGAINARLDNIDSFFKKYEFQLGIAMDAFSKADALEKRFESHLTRVETSMDKIEGKIEDVLKSNRSLEIEQARQAEKEKQQDKFFKYGIPSGLGSVGGAMTIGIFELIKYLKHI